MSRITFNSYCILTCNNGLSVWDFQYVKTMYKCCAVSPTLFEDTSRNLTNIQSKRFKTYHGNMSEVLKTHQEIEQTFNQNVQDISWKNVRSIKDTSRNRTNIQSKRSRHIMEACQKY